MRNDSLWNRVSLRVLLQYRLQESLRLRVNRLLHDWVDSFGPLVVEGNAGTQLIAIDLGQCGDSRNEHFSIVIVHRHRVIG